MLKSLFNKVVGLQSCDFIEKKLQHRSFPVNITKFSRTAFFIEHFWWLLLNFLRNLLISQQKFSQKLLRNHRLVLAAATFLKIINLQVFRSFCFSLNMYVKGVSRTHSDIKMEPFAKIVNSSRGVFRTESNV